MKEINPDFAVLIAQGQNTIKILEQNRQIHADFKQKEFLILGKSTYAAMVLSQIFVDFYTCLETFLFRVSQEFENNLKSEQWHKELLQQMSLQIPDIRPAVLSEGAFNLLNELLLFRHFRRYYFDYHYDWEKIEMIEKKYLAVFPLLTDNLNHFIIFLKQTGN